MDSWLIPWRPEHTKNEQLTLSYVTVPKPQSLLWMTDWASLMRERNESSSRSCDGFRGCDFTCEKLTVDADSPVYEVVYDAIV